MNGKPTEGLFDNLDISRCGQEYMQHQGKYPVIFITLKGVKDGKFESAYKALLSLIGRIYSEHRYLLDSPKLADDEKALFMSIITRQADEEVIADSLLTLTNFLYRHFDVKPILLIDEYDTPLQSGYLNGYYKEIVGLMLRLFGATLKGNPNLHKAMLTGILRVSKESLFSELNKVKVYSLLNNKYSQYFGFTEKEMSDLLRGVKFEYSAKKIKDWYNGYQVGDTVIYNPWSIANCIQEKGKLSLYWVNTSNNDLIKYAMMRGDAQLKIDFESLLQNIPVEQIMPEYFVFKDLDENPSTFWTLLLESGYLKSIATEQMGSRVRCQLLLPNQEVMIIFKEIVMEWFSDAMHKEYAVFLASLLNGDIAAFSKTLQAFLEKTASHFDTQGKNPEKFYHGFVLGLIASLENTHLIKSNRESGDGRYDVMIIPKDKTQKGIILEFKNASEEQDLNQVVEEALKQINDKNYEAELRQMGIKSILKLGLAFYGKKVVVLS